MAVTPSSGGHAPSSYTLLGRGQSTPITNLRADTKYMLQFQYASPDPSPNSPDPQSNTSSLSDPVSSSLTSPIALSSVMVKHLSFSNEDACQWPFIDCKDHK